jgi:hypothetical protein
MLVVRTRSRGLGCQGRRNLVGGDRLSLCGVTVHGTAAPCSRHQHKKEKLVPSYGPVVCCLRSLEGSMAMSGRYHACQGIRVIHAGADGARLNTLGAAPCNPQRPPGLSPAVVQGAVWRALTGGAMRYRCVRRHAGGVRQGDWMPGVGSTLVASGTSCDVISVRQGPCFSPVLIGFAASPGRFRCRGSRQVPPSSHAGIRG